jgi:hypothetical protein
MKTQMRKAQGGDAVEAMAKLTVADKGESSADGEAKDQPSSVCRVETRERRAVLCVCRVERDERSADERETRTSMSSVRMGLYYVVYILIFYKDETIKIWGL